MLHSNRNSQFYTKLRLEVENWQIEGLISPEQKERILQRYRQTEEVEQKAGSNKLITTISILGAILVGIGFILFMASNWSEIHRIGKLAIIFGALLISYILGFYVRYERKNYPKIGASLILLGTIIFGAAIFLIAQMYNITVHYPNGPLMWGLGILPLAYLLRFKSIMVLALLVLCLWLGMELTFHYEPDYSFVNMQMVVVYCMAGIMLWWIGRAHKGLVSLRELAPPYILVGIIITCAGMFIFTFKIQSINFGSFHLLPFYIPIMAVFIASAILYTIKGIKERGWLSELSVLTALLAFIFLLAVFFPDIDFYAAHSRNRVLFNIVYAIGIIGIICLGYVNKNPTYINIGLTFFVLDVIARYFDFFWELLPRSLFFIGGGLILLVGSVVLERKRRKILLSFQIKEELP